MSASSPIWAVQQFALPKRDNTLEEYEDASAFNAEWGRLAVADGASESSYAALWARLLVEEFVNAPGRRPAPWASWLPPLQQRWVTEVSGKALPWYTETKIEQGAFATFLGVVIHPGRLCRRRWYAIAVGDSCLFQVRNGKLHRKFPLQHSEEFGSTPWLIGSRTAPGRSLVQREVRGRGDWRPDDRMWLMTDALAQWFLESLEAGEKPWEMLEPLPEAAAPEQAFADIIDDLRNRQVMRNDDVTMLAVRL